MAGRTAGKVVVVTGASQGQGAAEARALQAEGATVIAADVRDPVDPVDGVAYRRLDVSSAEQWADLAEALRQEHGALHGLVNNAGITHREPLWTVTSEELERVLSVNLSGPLLGTQALAPLMSGGGSIVNVASLAALTGHFATAYTASKWGLRGVSRSTCTELGPLGIRVNCISAGPIATLSARGIGGFTHMVGKAAEKAPLKRNVTLEDIGKTGYYLLGDLSSGVTGETIYVDCGYNIVGV